jgi:hypothetical protein
MTSQERVLAACAFRRPDRTPRFDSFWEYPNAWRRRFGPPEGLTDIAIWVPEEATVLTRAAILQEDRGWIYEIDGWGRTIRRRRDAYFVETLAVPMPTGAEIDSVRFDPPDLEARYLRGAKDPSERDRMLARARQQHCVFGKTGGPYLRSTFVRGEEQFLIDIAHDPGLAGAIADKVGEHLTAVGVEEIHRWSLQETGIWIYDDMAYNDGPMFSPATFERIFLPVYRRMIRAYRQAGARYVFLHSDGDIRLLLDMLVDAGIDGLHPLERRAGMDPFQLRRGYPKLVLAGGICNSETLINGPCEKVRAESRALLDLGRDGGLIVGTHSISSEVPIENFAAYHESCMRYGVTTHPAGPVPVGPQETVRAPSEAR